MTPPGRSRCRRPPTKTNDSKAATNRINARGENQPDQTGRPQRSGDSVSAQDLLRREGRL